jgi:hypothetical protein
MDSCRWHFVGLYDSPRYAILMNLTNVSKKRIRGATVSIYPIPGESGASTNYEIREVIDPGERAKFEATGATAARRPALGETLCEVWRVTFADGSTWLAPARQMYP